MQQVRDSIHLDLDWNGDLLLNFFSRATGPLRDYLHPGIRDIGIGFDGQAMERNDSPYEQNKRNTHHDKAVLQGEVDERVDHCCSTVFWNSRALATTSCPGEIPERTSCMFPGSISPPLT